MTGIQYIFIEQILIPHEGFEAMVVSGMPPRTFVGRPSPRAGLSSVLWHPPSFPSPPTARAALPPPSPTKCQRPRAQKFEPLLSQTARVNAFANHLYKEKAWLSKLYIFTHIQKQAFKKPLRILFRRGHETQRKELGPQRRGKASMRWETAEDLPGLTVHPVSAKMVGSSQEFFPGE